MSSTEYQNGGPHTKEDQDPEVLPPNTVQLQDRSSTRYQNGGPHTKEDQDPEVLPPNTVQLQDRHGNRFLIGNAGDFWFPPFPLFDDVDYRQRAINIRDMEIRDDDVLICSFPKTGSHWNTELISMLTRGETNHKPEDEFMEGFIDFFPTSKVDLLPSPRLLFTHVPFKYLPRQALEKKIKIIFLERNPKDTLVSYYCHLSGLKYPRDFSSGTFQQFFELMLDLEMHYGNIFDFLLEYQDGIDSLPEGTVFTSVYEDLKLDPLGMTKKMNEYLGTGRSDELCEKIAEKIGFKSMKTYHDANASEWVKEMFVKDHPGMYRKGEVGDWKNWFTVDMNERFGREYQRRMSNYRLKYKYTL